MGLGGHGLGHTAEPVAMRCPACGAKGTNITPPTHKPGCRFHPMALRQADGDPDSDDGVSSLIVAAAVDTLMASDFGSDSSVDTSTPDTGSDFGGFDGGDSGGGGATGDF